MVQRRDVSIGKLLLVGCEDKDSEKIWNYVRLYVKKMCSTGDRAFSFGLRGAPLAAQSPAPCRATQWQVYLRPEPLPWARIGGFSD